MATNSIVIIEDDASIRDYLAATVQGSENLELRGLASTLAEGIALCLSHTPDVALVDLGLPDGSGIDLIRHLRAAVPALQCLVITGFNDESHVFAALEAGARGYIYKHEGDQEIARAVHQLLAGGAPISPVIAKLMLTRFQSRPETTEPAAAPMLTDREVEVLNLVSRGYTAREIGAQLGIAYYTVTTHVKNIYGKLEVRSRTEALFEAKQLGLLNDGRLPNRDS